jgi:hypothetical protein
MSVPPEAPESAKVPPEQPTASAEGMHVGLVVKPANVTAGLPSPFSTIEKLVARGADAYMSTGRTTAMNFRVDFIGLSITGRIGNYQVNHNSR